MTFGQYLRLEREKIGIPQNEMAYRLRISERYYSDVEKDKRNPVRYFIDRLISHPGHECMGADYLYYLAGYIPTDIWEKKLNPRYVRFALQELRDEIDANDFQEVE